jgi:hypothetical protein
MTWVIMAVIVWIICGILAYGLTLGYFQREYPVIADADYAGDAGRALVFGCAGPLGLMIALPCSGFGRHGLMWRRQ